MKTVVVVGVGVTELSRRKRSILEQALHAQVEFKTINPQTARYAISLILGAGATFALVDEHSPGPLRHQKIRCLTFDSNGILQEVLGTGMTRRFHL